MGCFARLFVLLKCFVFYVCFSPLLNCDVSSDCECEISKHGVYDLRTKRGRDLNIKSKMGGNQLSITLGVINTLSIISACGCISQNRHVIMFLNTNFSFVHWLNKYVGVVANLTVLGDVFLSLSSVKSYIPLLKPGIGVKWSYNGGGSNGNVSRIRCSGMFMINVPCIGIMDVIFRFSPKEVGFSVGLIPFEMIVMNIFVCGVKLGGLDIVALKNNDWMTLGFSNLSYAKIFFGINWHV